MNYGAAVSDFFRSPKWFMNLLLGGLCLLIPLLGMMVVLGWLIAGFWTREEEDFESFPPFEFSQFERYLTLGLWPTLVILAVAFVTVPVMWAVMMVPALLGVLIGGNDPELTGRLMMIVMPLVMVTFLLLMLIQLVAMVPLVIRATLMQDFVKAFDFRFARDFFRLVWKETVLSLLFLTVTGMLLLFLGALAFCVGMYLTPVVSYFAGMHLEKQLYLLYLSRGGEPVPRSVALSGAASPAS